MAEVVDYFADIQVTSFPIKGRVLSKDSLFEDFLEGSLPY